MVLNRLSALLVALMLVGLTACGTKAAPEEEPKPSATGQEDSEAKTAKPEQAETKPAKEAPKATDKADPPAKEGTPSEDAKEKRDALLAEARKLAATGNPDEAIAKAKEALKHSGPTETAPPNQVLAIAYEKKGDNANAVKHYNNALKAHCAKPNSKLGDIIRAKITNLGGAPDC